MNILIIAPHADDETLSMGGTICKYINKGFEEAFKDLTSMITTSSDQEKIKNLSINQI